jgi:hypothetical protein
MIRLVTTLIAAAAWCAFAPVPGARAACLQWDMSGHWNFRQSNGFVVTTDLQQSGSTLKGKARYFGASGPVEGDVGPHGFHLTVNWHNGTFGYYEGHIEDSGLLSFGYTYDMANPGAGKASWSAYGRKATCIKTAAPRQAPDAASTDRFVDILRRERNR